MVASHNNVIVGGALHCICGNTCFAFIGGGCDNCVRGDSGACGQVIVGGHLNVSGDSSSDNYTFIGGGCTNCVDCTFGIIVGGALNKVNGGCFGVVVGGCGNYIDGDSAFIGSGKRHTVPAAKISAVGGISNTASAACSFIGAGSGSYISGSNDHASFIGAGKGNKIQGHLNLGSSYSAIVAPVIKFLSPATIAL
jgi:hypothetical protein